MKRKIEDYKDQKVAIYCSSKEEWDKIDNLFGKKGLTRDYGDINNPDNMFVDCIHINRMGTASKEWYEQKGYIVYPASDFLETEIIPEYVEYIDTKYKGQIVKVEEWTSHSFCCIRFENGQREQPFKHLVKSSTKDAYEAQNKPKQLAGDNLLPNEIYVTDYPKNYIFKTSETGKGYSSYICNNNTFDLITDTEYIWSGNIRLATIEEKKWLNTCITQNKFIPKKDLHLYDNSGLLIQKENMEEIVEEANGFYIPIQNGKLLSQSIKKGFRKALPNEIPITSECIMYNGEIFEIKESFKTEIYDFGDIYIAPVIKKTKKLETITIESTTNLELNLTKIKSKQIKTIKI